MRKLEGLWVRGYLRKGLKTRDKRMLVRNSLKDCACEDTRGMVLRIAGYESVCERHYGIRSY